MPNPRAHILERWRLPTQNVDEREFLSARDLPSGVYLIRRGRYEIPILIRRTPSPIGIFGFHGAKNREKFSPPVFEGAGLTQELAVNAILHSDPILSLSGDVTIGWFAGTSELPLQSVLKSYQEHITRVLQLHTRVFLGGSGGGFAALYYGLKNEAEVIFAMAPQTIIRNHNRGAVRRYFQTAFGVDSYDEVAAWVREQLCCDIRSVWPRNLRSRVVYLQNSGDRRHMDKHLGPLREHAQRHLVPEDVVGPGLCVVLRHWADDHVPPPKTLVMEQLRKALTQITGNLSDV